jgi:dynein heavy chain, axonemal
MISAEIRSMLSIPTLAVQGNFPDAVKEMTSSIVLATLDIYQTAMASLLPTPTKSHYLFNLRDVSRVMGGMLLLKPSVLQSGALAKAKFARLWVHDILRVFYDRSAHLDRLIPSCSR